MSGFFCEAPQRKKERRDSKNKVTKTCREGKKSTNKETDKKGEIFWKARKQRREISILLPKVADSEKTHKEK